MINKFHTRTRCQLINPLCPDDLCILPHGHKGYHRLGTMSEPMKLDMRHTFKMHKGTSTNDDELARLGWEHAQRLGLHKKWHIYD